MQVKTMRAARWFKCVCCGEQVRTDEKFIQVVNESGKVVRGERYCLECEAYAIANNDMVDRSEDDDNEAHLRNMEAFAAYRAARRINYGILD